MTRTVPLHPFVLLGLAAVGCTGNGSDVGPRLDHLPSASNKVLVLDDQGRGVAAARVAVAGVDVVTGRSGRADLLANPTGRRLVSVDAALATADDGDRLASLAFAAEIPGQDLPYAVYLPDTRASAVQTVATGVGLSATTLDDTATSGARLLLGNGTVVADVGAQVDLRVAALAREHLPGELPAAASGAQLWTRGIWVDPPTATFAPAATLEVVDDLALPALGGASLYHLDATTGEWTLVSTTQATSSGGRLQLANGVAAGGLYAYAATIAATATVRGRVLDLQNRAVFGALVRVDSTPVLADNLGRFTAVVAGEFADGSARAANVELRHGALWLPAGRTVATPVLGGGADVDLGDLVLDTQPGGNLRLQVIEVGRAETFRRLALSSVESGVASVTMTDARGQCAFEDVPFGFYGVLDGRPSDRFELIVAKAAGLLGSGSRWTEQRLFFDDRAWFIGSRSTSAEVRDAVGGGPVRDAVVVRGSSAGNGYSGITREGGVVFVGRDFDGRATASVRTVSGATSVVSAFTIERPNGDHLELPLRRAMRGRGGAFDRHGVLRGSVTGFVSGTLDVRADRPLEFDEWFDRVLLDVASTEAVPVRTGVGTSLGFAAGVALPRGHVVAIEGTTSGVFTLTGVAAQLDLEVAEGTSRAGDLALRRTLGSFTAPQAFADLDAGLTVADFRFDLGFEQPSGRIVDVARGIGGGIAASGSDAVLQLPVLADEFAGGAWLVAMKATDAGGTLRQRSLLRFAGTTADATPLLGVPTIAAPTDGGTVAADGFTVDFTLPAGSLYATIELSSPGTDALEWTVVVPPDRTQFAFVRLPTEATSPLVAGRSYTLTLTAYRADLGLVLQQSDPYRELTTHWRAIGAGERGVRALASRTITITAN